MFERVLSSSRASTVHQIMPDLTVKCFRTKPKINNPFMGSLPQERLVQNSPFTITGVDYAGPIFIRDNIGRGCKTIKGYISLFVCFSTRAIHLELVTQLTTEAFLAALRRFIARRGKPTVIHSDNGTNFLGARNALRELGAFLQNKSNQRGGCKMYQKSFEKNFRERGADI